MDLGIKIFNVVGLYVIRLTILTDKVACESIKVRDCLTYYF